MRITEPMTMATDYLLAVLAIGSGASLQARASRRGRTAPRLWILAFGVAALAAAMGGTLHGSKLYFEAQARTFLWRLTLGAIFASAALFVAAGIHSVKSAPVASQDARARGKAWLMRAVAASLVGLTIQRAGLSLHTHFNHNDLYHLIQGVALCWLYLGVRALHDLEAPADT